LTFKGKENVALKQSPVGRHEIRIANLAGYRKIVQTLNFKDRQLPMHQDRNTGLWFPFISFVSRGRIAILYNCSSTRCGYHGGRIEVRSRRPAQLMNETDLKIKYMAIPMVSASGPILEAGESAIISRLPGPKEGGGSARAIAKRADGIPTTWPNKVYIDPHATKAWGW